jgi:hypothetical protein
METKKDARWYDYAPCQTWQQFHWCGWEVLQHPAHRSLRRHLLEQWFVNNDVIAAMMTWLHVVAQDFFVKDFSALVPRWDKYLNRDGDSVGK